MFNSGGGWDVCVALMFGMSGAILMTRWHSGNIIDEVKEIVISAFVKLGGME